MARQKKQNPRQRQPNTADFLQEAGRKSEMRIPAESVQYTTGIASGINQKVKSLVGGLTGVKHFYLQKDKNEDFANFYEENKEGIESLLKYDLAKTYSLLVENNRNRQQIYHDLEQQGVISKTELNHLLGVISNQPYHNYLRTLGQRTPPAPHAAPNPDPNATPAAPATPQPALQADDIDNLSAATAENLSIIVERLKGENKLSDAEAAKLMELGPKTDQQVKEARDVIFTKIKQHDLRTNTSFFQEYQLTIKKESDLIAEVDSYTEQYNELVRGLVQQIQELYKELQTDKARESRLNMLSKEVGLPLKPGQVLWGVDLTNWSGDPDESLPKNNRIEITGISYGAEDNDPDILPEFRLNIPTFEPVIEFTALAQDGSGKTIDYKLSASNFRKWTIANQVTQKFENTADLEKDLGIVDFIKPGQSFEYLEPMLHGEDEEPQFQAKTAKIEKIENGQIFLDQSVIIDHPAPGNGLRAPRRVKQMDLGDFARWYKKANAVPEISNIEQLDNVLEAHHHDLVREMGWSQDHGEAIKLAALAGPLVLISAYDPSPDNAITIKGIKDEMIQLDDGDEIKPHQLYRLIREQGYTRPTPEQMKELIEDAKARKNKKDEEKLTELAEKAPLAKSSSAVQAAETPKVKPVGYWKNLWNQTKILNLMQILELFYTAPKDRIKEWLKDKSERAVNIVGKDFYKGFPALGGLNDLADTYENKNTSKNSGDIKSLMEWYDNNLYAHEVMDKLRQVKDIDNFTEAKIQFKAAVQLVIKKGMVRWEDDKDLWAAANALNRDGKATYPDKFHNIPGIKGLAVKVGDPGPLKNPLISIFDQYRAIIDKVYGEGTFDSWNGQNEGEYQRQKEEAAKGMHKYEFMQGGIGRQLQKMLYDWEEGNPVNQAEFDGLLTGAISGMEVNMEQGMLLFVSAFSVKNKKTGNTLLTFSRLNPYIKNLSDHLVYVFFAVGHDLVDDEGKPLMEQNENGEWEIKKGKFSINNFQKIYREVIQQDMAANKKTNFEKFTAGKNTINWIQSQIVVQSKVKERASNKAGNPNTDVGLYHYLGPLMWQENDLDKVIGKTYGSLQKPDILKNMYAGYNNQLIIRANKINQGKSEEENVLRATELAQMVYSFIYFNNILKHKIRINQPYMRMSEAMFNESPAVDKKRKVFQFAEETEKFTSEFALGIARLSGNLELMQLAKETILSSASHLDDETEIKFRDKLYKAIVDLAQTHPKELAALAKEKASLMKGMSGAQLTWEEQQKMKAAA